MAATLTRPMTVEEFRDLAETGPFYYELHHGELVKVTRPNHQHYRVQEQLRLLLAAAAADAGFVGTEFAFRALPELELRVADVAFVSQERWDQIDLTDNLRGAPELVIEVLSRSNSAAKMIEKEALCLENGCREFWVVHPELRQVKVSTPDGITTTFRHDQEIPLRIFGDGSLKVAAIFS